jgi:diaminopimelate decarboxylase
VLRVTPGIDAHTHEYVRTGHDDSKFGFTLSLGLADEAALAVRDASTSTSSACTRTSARRSSAPTRSSPTPR